MAISGWLKSNLDLTKETITKDLDHLFCVCGDERAGKSLLAMQMAMYCDPTFCLERVCMTAEEFLKAVQTAKQYQAVVYDEAMTGLSSREAMSRCNKTLIRVLAEAGQRNLFLFICIPDFFSLDVYVALHRSRCLIQVYFGDNFTRGSFAFFAKDKKRQLYFLGKKMHNPKAVKPDFYGTFSGQYVLDEKAYRKKKADSLQLHTLDLNESRTVESHKFASLLCWLIKEKKLVYDDVLNGMRVFGTDMTYDAVRQVVHRHSSNLKKEEVVKTSESDVV